jgi:uncharacterized membrane protein YuzA (DUF378 family)
MTELLLFGSTFGMVFFMGFQSLAVNTGMFWVAGLNSLIIGAFNLTLYRTAPHVSGSWEIAAYIIGGPCGILCAMKAHKHVAKWVSHGPR